MDAYEIRNTKKKDLDLIFELFEKSVRYQEEHGYPVWKNYDKAAIIRDVENKNQYKVIVDSHIGIVFSVCYSDKIIWRHRDNEKSIYLHRLVVNPSMKGRKLFGVVLEWAIEHARENKRDAIRMDTWAANPTLIDYYRKFGFEFVENYTTPDTDQLPVHNRNLPLALLEYQLAP